MGATIGCESMGSNGCRVSPSGSPSSDGRLSGLHSAGRNAGVNGWSAFRQTRLMQAFFSTRLRLVRQICAGWGGVQASAR